MKLKLLKQPNTASCLPTAFASVLWDTPEEIFDFLGHDGMDIIWNDLKPPLCYRSFHIQEMYAYALMRNYAVTTFTPKYGSAPEGEEPYIMDNERFRDYISYYIGVLSGVTKSGCPHAVAWDGHLIMDPSTGKLSEQDFTVTHAHLITMTK